MAFKNQNGSIRNVRQQYTIEIDTQQFSRVSSVSKVSTKIVARLKCDLVS